MIDQDKSKQQLMEEVAELRQRVLALEGVDRERRRAEEELAKSKAILTAAVECLPFDFFALDPAGRCVLQNAVSRRYYGDAIGKRAEDVCPDAGNLARWLDKHRQAFAGERVEGDVELTIGGEQRHLHNIITPILAGGEVVGILGVNVDITDRKRAEQALQKAHEELERRVADRTAELTCANEELRQSRDELQSIYDGMADGLHILNLETRKAVRSNPAMCRMMGYSQEEILSLSQDDAHPPDELPGILQRFQAHVEGRASLEMEVPMLRKDGTVFHADITTSRIFYNEAPCLVCFFRDRTERRQAQAALEQERESLWRMLQAGDHERQVISYDIHDGLAQYLAAAGMQFQVHHALKEESPAEAEKAYETAVELVRQAHAESRRLISEVRPPVIDETGLETAMSQLVYEQRRRGGPKITFQSDVQFARLPPILENAIYRIVQEALTNACKHSKSKQVMVTLAQVGHEVRLEVRDWGIGFNPASPENGRFGLEGIRQRVRLLGGRLTIESKPDSGTMVQVFVPIVARPGDQ